MGGLERKGERRKSKYPKVEVSYRPQLANKLRPCKFCLLFNINEGLGLLKLANTVLILINPSPSNVKLKLSLITTIFWLQFLSVWVVSFLSLFFYFFFFASVSPPLGTEEKEVTQWGEILSESIFFISRHLQFHQLRIQKVFYPIMVQLYIQWQNKHGKFTKKNCSGTRYFSLGGTFTLD